MKIVNITGGLGNQMFQYAFAMALKYRNPQEEVFVDIQHYNTIVFKKFKGINLHNGYEIDKVFPKAKLPVAGVRQLMKFSYWIPNYILSRLGRKFLPIRKKEYIPPYSMNYSYDEKALNWKGDGYFEGYWQSYNHFGDIKEELQKVYAHPKPNQYNAALISNLESCNSVGIHVRRGDYLAEPEFRGICGLDYYEKGIKEILSDEKKYVFFIFSNDMQWCQENIAPLVGDNRIVFISGNKGKDSCWDMFLMTHCKDLIIANSSFSWWGAFLNKKVDRVICPKPWLNRDCNIDIYNPSWILVPCYSEDW